MNKQPVYYMQTDARWKNKPYRVPGETSTIGGSGCGPSCAAMIIETMTGKTFTPEDACKWSVEHGHKALNQGTYYSYFTPQFAAFGIDCQQLGWTNLYGKPTHADHTKAFNMLKEGYYLIACMGPGTWTKGGHFIVAWWEDGKVRINDPASKASTRLNGNINTFKSQVKYYWVVDAREFNKKNGGDEPVVTDTNKDFIKSVQSQLLTKYAFDLAVDGSFGPASKKAMVKAVQTEINRLYGKSLKIDGSFGPASQRAFPDIKKVVRNDLVWLIQACLALKGYAVELDSSYGPATESAIKAFQQANGLTVDGICGRNTMAKLLK